MGLVGFTYRFIDVILHQQEEDDEEEEGSDDEEGEGEGSEDEDAMDEEGAAQGALVPLQGKNEWVGWLVGWGGVVDRA